VIARRAESIGCRTPGTGPTGRWEGRRRWCISDFEQCLVRMDFYQLLCQLGSSIVWPSIASGQLTKGSQGYCPRLVTRQAGLVLWYPYPPVGLNSQLYIIGDDFFLVESSPLTASSHSDPSLRPPQSPTMPPPPLPPSHRSTASFCPCRSYTAPPPDHRHNHVPATWMMTAWHWS
jgi:hypothetical protein